MTEEVNSRGRSILRKLRDSNKALSGRQLQEVEAPGASEEDMGTSPGRSTAYFVVKARATIQERVKSPSKSKKKLQKSKPRKISQSRSCTLLRAILHTFPSMWATSSPQHQLLQKVTLKLHGLCYHHHHLWHQPCLTISSQKGIAKRSNNTTHERSPKLA